MHVHVSPQWGDSGCLDDDHDPPLPSTFPADPHAVPTTLDGSPSNASDQENADGRAYTKRRRACVAPALGQPWSAVDATPPAQCCTASPDRHSPPPPPLLHASQPQPHAIEAIPAQPRVAFSRSSGASQEPRDICLACTVCCTQLPRQVKGRAARTS